MKNKDIVLEFLEQNKAGRSSQSLTSSGDKLYSYATVIAQWYEGKLYINNTKYSQTTSRHQSLLLRHAENRVGRSRMIILDRHFDRGTDNLIEKERYMKKVSRVVHKYRLMHQEGKFTVVVSKGAKFLTVAIQDKQPYIYFLENIEEKESEHIILKAICTERPGVEEGDIYLGTVKTYFNLVVHYFMERDTDNE